jgi:hypothetical protein
MNISKNLNLNIMNKMKASNKIDNFHQDHKICLLYLKKKTMTNPISIDQWLQVWKKINWHQLKVIIKFKTLIEVPEELESRPKIPRTPIDGTRPKIDKNNQSLTNN